MISKNKNIRHQHNENSLKKGDTWKIVEVEKDYLFPDKIPFQNEKNNHAHNEREKCNPLHNEREKCNPLHNEKGRNCHNEKDCYKSGCCKGDKGDKGDSVATIPLTASNTSTSLAVPIVIPFIAGTNCTTLASWNKPIDDASAFNPVTGVYTVPITGDYQIELTVNYATSSQIPVDPELTNVPTAEIYNRTLGTKIVGSIFPTLDICIPCCASDEIDDTRVSAILSRGQVIINAVVRLLAGHQIDARICLNGLTHPGTINCQLNVDPITITFSSDKFDTTLSIYRLK